MKKAWMRKVLMRKAASNAAPMMTTHSMAPRRCRRCPSSSSSFWKCKSLTLSGLIPLQKASGRLAAHVAFTGHDLGGRTEAQQQALEPAPLTDPQGHPHLALGPL